MDWRHAHRLVATGVRGDVLTVLVLGIEPMSGREIARRAGASQQAARTVLDDLETQGLVTVRAVPPAYLYELNRDHVAVPAAEALVHLRETLFARIVERVRGWSPPPVNVTVFGSVVRGDATASSDLDLLIVRPDDAAAGSADGEVEVPELADAIRRWCGNSAQILELPEHEVRARAASRDRVLAAIRREGRTLFGPSLDELTVLERVR